MFTYILRRILLMIPTFFAISLIVFIILNLAPGTPGAQAGAQGQESADESGSKREAYRIFKRQFGLDKPVVLNLRYKLKDKNVLTYLTYIARKDASLKNKIKAEETLENYGSYILPHLIRIINTTKDEDIKRVAVKKFSENARSFAFRSYKHLEGIEAKELTAKFDEKNSKLKKENFKSYKHMLVNFVNKAIEANNAKIKSLWYTSKDSPEKRKKVIAEINSLYKKRAHWYAYSDLDKVKITLTDTRFAKYWWNLLHFDFGISHVDRKPVLEKILQKIPYSITLSLTSLLIAYLIAIPLGIFSAIKQNTLADRVITVKLFMLYSLPSFFVGTLLLKLFSAGGDYWHWFPTGGFRDINYASLTTWGQLKDIGWHIVLPIICLSYASLASLSRYARSGLLDVIRSDYIKTARAKGLPEYIVIIRHAVRNGMIPVLTLLASLLPVLIGGSVIIEYIFAIDGMGSLTLTAITMRDYNTIMGTTLISAILVMFGILLSDISYALVDPRISFK